MNDKINLYMTSITALILYFLAIGLIISIIFNIFLNLFNIKNVSIIDGVIIFFIYGSIKAYLSNRYFVKLDIDYERNSAKILFFKPKENNLKEG